MISISAIIANEVFFCRNQLYVTQETALDFVQLKKKKDFPLNIPEGGRGVVGPGWSVGAISM
jgi:hypothetical protein